MKVTIQDIVWAGACHNGVRYFRNLFGNEAEVNENNIALALRNLPSFQWACRYILQDGPGAAVISIIEAELDKSNQYFIRASKDYADAMAACRKEYLDIYDKFYTMYKRGLFSEEEAKRTYARDHDAYHHNMIVTVKHNDIRLRRLNRRMERRMAQKIMAVLTEDSFIFRS